MIEEAFVTHLKAQTGLTDIVGTRIFPVHMQDDELPQLIYQRISTPRERSHEGEVGLAHPRFQFTAFSNSYDEARAILREVRYSLQGFSGLMGDEDRRVDSVSVVDQTDGWSFDLRIYNPTIDLIFWHKEEVS